MLTEYLPIVVMGGLAAIFAVGSLVAVSYNASFVLAAGVLRVSVAAMVVGDDTVGARQFVDDQQP